MPNALQTARTNHLSFFIFLLQILISEQERENIKNIKRQACQIEDRLKEKRKNRHEALIAKCKAKEEERQRKKVRIDIWMSSTHKLET